MNGWVKKFRSFKKLSLNSLVFFTKNEHSSAIGFNLILRNRLVLFKIKLDVENKFSNRYPGS
jgi:hypothetical protein